MVYNNCGGERYANFIRNVGSTVFRDVPQEELLRFNNHLLNYGDEARLEELATAGLSADYVFRETQAHWRAWPGNAAFCPESTSAFRPARSRARRRPEDTHAAVTAALRAGAHGVIYSRKYSEMRLPNLEAAGRRARGPARLVPRISA